MNLDSEKTQTITAEDYSKAMNFIAQNLLSSLVQSVEKLPSELSSRKVIAQALSAFLANVIYKQYPKDANSCQQMLDELSKLVQMQIDQMFDPAQSN
ncbi:MAG: hypothetical protein H0T84_09510 [Tatlockia sp.]|nr:hypothetical protein [Tatlockia sp.]